MGGSVSKCACSVSDRTNGKRSLFCGKSSRKVSAATKSKVTAFLEEDYNRRLYTSVPELTSLFSRVPADEDILLVHYENGFNLLQKCVAENNVEAVKLILSRDPDVDVDNYPCSLPLHIACMKGYPDVAQCLIEHGARLDAEARMCWPGPHLKSCPGLKNESKSFRRETTPLERSLVKKEGRDKRQNAFFYTIDGKQSTVLDYLLYVQEGISPSICKLGPMLEAAYVNQAWSCCNILLEHKAEELDAQDMRSQAYAASANPQMTFLHFLFNMVSKPAGFMLKTCKALLYNGLISDVNTLDSLGNTPVHSLIIRYAFEETRRMWLRGYQPWDQVETKEMIKLLLRGGAAASINQPGNSTLSLIVRHINDWQFIFDLLNTILDVGASPLIKDKEGHCPLMVCIIKLINDDLFQKLDFVSKTYFSYCLGVLCKAGANPNFEIQPSLNSLHGLIFTISENFSCSSESQMVDNFDFILSVLNLFFQNGLSARAATAKGKPNVFRGVLKLVEKARSAIEVEKIYELVVLLIQYGVDPNVELQFPGSRASVFFFMQENPFFVAERSYLLAHMFAVFAEKQDLLLEARHACLSLLNLIYYSMGHGELSKCLDLLYARLPATPPEGPLRILCDAVRAMRFTPRELKHSVRVFINRYFLNGKPGLYADQLSLPKDARNYLKSYNP